MGKSNASVYVMGFENGLRQVSVLHVLEDCVEVELIYHADEESRYTGAYVVPFASIVIKSK